MKFSSACLIANTAQRYLRNYPTSINIKPRTRSTVFNELLKGESRGTVVLELILNVEFAVIGLLSLGAVHENAIIVIQRGKNFPF